MSKTIRTDAPFAAVSNAVLFDGSLSLEAKGLFAFLRAKPDRWDFSCERVADELGVSRPSVTKYVRELEAAGLLTREGADWTVAYDRKEFLQSPAKIFPRQKSFRLIKKDIYISPDKEILTHSEAAPRAAFDFAETMKRWEDGDDETFQLLAYFFARRKLSFDTRQKLDDAVSRHIKAARKVARYSGAEVRKAMDECDRNERSRGIRWTLETVFKELTK